MLYFDTIPIDTYMRDNLQTAGKRQAVIWQKPHGAPLGSNVCLETSILFDSIHFYLDVPAKDDNHQF